jgi:glycerophosphoryl diester phosphodiesterase
MGIVIPTLDELLDAFPEAHYLMEIKQSDPPIVDEVLAILAAHEVGERVVIASFDDPTLEAVRAASPDTLTAMSAPEMAEFLDRLDDPTYTPPCVFLQSPWEVSTQEVIDRAHALGMKVHPWTVNGALTMGDLIARGVDGLMSDDPALLVEVAG